MSQRTCTIRIMAAANATLIPRMLISVETPVFLNTFIFLLIPGMTRNLI